MTAEVPVSNLTAIANISVLTKIYSASSIKMMMDKSRSSTGVNVGNMTSIPNSHNLTGSGVIIGFID